MEALRPFQLTTRLNVSQDRLYKALPKCTPIIEGNRKFYNVEEVEKVLAQLTPKTGERPKNTVTLAMIIRQWGVSHGKLKLLMQEGKFPKPDGDYICSTFNRVNYWRIEAVNKALGKKVAVKADKCKFNLDRALFEARRKYA